MIILQGPPGQSSPPGITPPLALAKPCATTRSPVATGRDELGHGLSLSGSGTLAVKKPQLGKGKVAQFISQTCKRMLTSHNALAKMNIAP